MTSPPFATRSLALVLLLCLPRFSLAAQDVVRIDAPSALATLLRDHLPLVTEREADEVSDSELDVLVRTTPDSARKLLETEGYFDANVQVQAVDGKPRTWLVKVDAGEPVRIDHVEVELQGAATQEADGAALRAALLTQWALPSGAIFRQADWDRAKAQALQVLTADRFPLAKIVTSQATIDPLQHRAQLHLLLDSGPLVRLGALQIHGLSRYPPALVQKLADFRPGDPFRLQALQDFQAGLEHSNQFSRAVVSADLQHIDANGVAPVVVELTEFPRKKLELGLTFDTDVGPGVRVGFDHYNLFGEGLTGSSVLSWDRSQQALNLGVALPRSADGYVHTVTASVKRTDIQNLITQSESVGIWRIYSRARDEWRLGLNYLQETQHVINQDSQLSSALLPTIGLTRRAVDSLLHPRSGYLLDGMLSGTIGNWLSTTSYVRAYGRAAQYWTPFSPAWGTLMARLELGRVWARNSSEVPNTELFRAGGTNSVRGYDYQSLGLPGANNAVVGGAVLLTSSLEYQIPIYQDWALALFTDAGNVAGNWRDLNLKRSEGIGLRWFSPVAPLSFDLAKAQGSKNLAWSMSLGLAF